MTDHLAAEGFAANYSVEGRNQSRQVLRIDYNPDESLLYVRETFSGVGANSNICGETYADGESAYRYHSLREPRTTETSVDTESQIGRMAPGSLSDTDLEASHGIERDETTLIVYDITGYHVDGTRYTNATGRVLIDERGVLREYTLSFPAPLPGGTEKIEFELSTETPTIDEPNWVDELKDSSE